MTTSTPSINWFAIYKVAIGVGGVIGAVYGAGKYRKSKHPVLECGEFVRDTVIGAGIGCLYVATFPVSTLVAEAIERVPVSAPSKPDAPSTQGTAPQTDINAATDDKTTGDSGMDVEF